MSPDPEYPRFVFYDIASAAPLRTFAPNPWKTRLALNFSGVSYRTEWVQMPDIQAVREKLGVPANRTLPDGSAYHTLPLLHDTQTGTFVGDSFEIALYLDRLGAASEATSRKRLFRPQTTGLTAVLNAHADTLFTTHISLANRMPFDSAVEAKVSAIFAARFAQQAPSTTSLHAGEATPAPSGSPEEVRERLFVRFEAVLGELAKAYAHMGGTTDHFWRVQGTAEPQRQRAGREQAEALFLDGDEPCYADMIVGAWLKAFKASMSSDEWERVAAWQGGRWGRLVEALDEFSEMK